MDKKEAEIDKKRHCVKSIVATLREVEVMIVK